MSLYDFFLYIALEFAIIYSIYLIAEYIRKVKRRKSALKKKANDKKVAMLCKHSDQRLRLDMMALDAMRQMSAAAAKHHLK